MTDTLASFAGVISIHALREEGDTSWWEVRPSVRQFLSTPSARRATHPGVLLQRPGTISIHALREEGDLFRRIRRKGPNDFYPRPPRGGRPRETVDEEDEDDFYPRPPRGGRRAGKFHMPIIKPISIHALREEGDFAFAPIECGLEYFYPRPPRGGRQDTR